MPPTHAVAAVLGTHATTHAPATHCCPSAQVPHESRNPHRLLVAPHTAAPQPGSAGQAVAALWQEDVVPAALNTHLGVAPLQTVGHVTDPPQPSLTCPHVMPATHAVAAVFGTHDDTQAPPTHCEPSAQVPQTLVPPQRLFVSPQTAAPHPGLAGHAAA